MMGNFVDTFQSVTGNDAQQSVLISNLFLIFLAVAVVMYVLVIAFLLWALLRRRDGPSREKGLRTVLGGWVVVIALILGGLTITTWFYDRGMAASEEGKALEIEVTARQWWWEVRYANSDSSKIVRSANELYLPQGARSHITLKSSDVIHSFWIPNLAGKQDMIPGRQIDITLTPLTAGQFRGQCAEFCGLQHANMALDVTVLKPADFAAWYATSLKTPLVPASGPARAGYDLVTGAQCASCHNVSGTPASGQVAPDLTHFASRKSIAAGRLPMSRDNIAKWIADPQGVKPGNNMPKVPLSQAQLAAVTAYLETLR